MATYSASASYGRESETGNSSKYLDLSPEGYNKIIKDILSSDAGLASLATGENLSGGYGSSVKAQLAQDLVLNIAGEMAKLTAPTIENTRSVKKKFGLLGGAGSVICTELERQGLLASELYDAGIPHFLALPEKTVAGYKIWASKVVPYMQKYPELSRLLAPIAQARYEMITTGEFRVLGAITIYIGQPICYVIGTILKLFGKDNYGDLSSIS